VVTEAQPASDGVSTGRATPRGARIARVLEENGTLVVVLTVFAILLVVDLRHELVADGWMALLSGREVAQHGLPSHDALTVWADGKRWVDQQWFAQLTLYELDRLGGIRLVMLVHALPRAPHSWLWLLPRGGSAPPPVRLPGSAYPSWSRTSRERPSCGRKP